MKVLSTYTIYFADEKIVVRNIDIKEKQKSREKIAKKS